MDVWRLAARTGPSFRRNECDEKRGGAGRGGPLKVHRNFPIDRQGASGQPDDAEVCWISFPGKYKGGWDALTAQTTDSVACVFLCTPEDGEGRHYPDPDNKALCLCHRIYGQSKPWGCYWYKRWKDNVQRAVEQEQRLKAVFFAGQVGRGKVSMKDLPTVDLWDGIGLGGSQKAELATADEEGWEYEEVDVATVLLGAFPEGAAVDAWCDAAKVWRRGTVAKFKKEVRKVRSR
eukprot:s3821_g2.t1